MKRVHAPLPLLLIFATILIGQSPHRLDSTDYTDPSQYAFLNPLLGGVEVVSLAESIHMTHEFPLIRIGMVRYMNENLGFGVLALEGSPEDLWATQDQFLGSPGEDADVSRAMQGIFGLWNTPEMRQLFRYAAGTWRTSHPLYLTAYDIQPGTGSGTQGIRVFQLLLERLKIYAPPPPDFEENKWIDAASVLTYGCSRYQPSNEPMTVGTIETLEQWIALAAPQVEKRYPNLPHAATLRLIPANMRATLSLCNALGSAKGDRGLYKRTRDERAAQFALALKETAPAGKLMLWAHISHLFYDDSKGSTSVGEILHSLLGRRLYTLATFALGGGTVMLFDDSSDDIGYAFVRGIDGPFESHLIPQCKPACFADMRDTSDPLLLKPQPVWSEAGIESMTLPKNFDGIVWVDNVHPPGLPLVRLLVLSGIHYQRQLQWAGVGVLAGLTGLVVWGVRKCRAKAQVG